MTSVSPLWTEDADGTLQAYATWKMDVPSMKTLCDKAKVMMHLEVP